MVIVVRNDIKLGPGKMAAQVAHAAVNCAFSAKKNYKKYFDGWYDEGQKKVVVKAKSLGELHELQFQAKNAGLPNSLITDAGHTQLPPGTVTCLGIGPGPEAAIDKITGHLKLD
ncbi:MAG: peptidyl-tRNA hydrolase [Euryarchaeota archaeon]|nr:peptidyl-tRNA hydrolase [Euryarchaeota archaeon]